MAFDKQSVILKKFTWGLSSDDFLSTWDQFLYAENLDINTNSYFVTLNKNSEWRFTTTDTVNWFIEAKVWTSKKVFAYCDDWKIYDTSDWSLQYTMWDWVLQAWIFNWYIYFLTNNATPLNRITIANANSNNWTWNVTENIITTWDSIPTSSDIYPVIVLLNEFFYLWSWAWVYKVDSNDIVEEFDIWDWDVVWLSTVWWVIKVYTGKWTMAFWDWISTSIDSFIEIQEQTRW